MTSQYPLQSLVTWPFSCNRKKKVIENHWYICNNYTHNYIINDLSQSLCRAIGLTVDIMNPSIYNPLIQLISYLIWMQYNLKCIDSHPIWAWKLPVPVDQNQCTYWEPKSHGIWKLVFRDTKWCCDVTRLDCTNFRRPEQCMQSSFDVTPLFSIFIKSN